MNNIIVIILFILVIILFINDITQLFSLKEGAVDLPTVISATVPPTNANGVPLRSTSDKCPDLENQWQLFNGVEFGANGTTDKPNKISSNPAGDISNWKLLCEGCDKTEWVNDKCKKI